MSAFSRLNDLPSDEAYVSFLRCCGASRWARAMTAARPFATHEAMFAAAASIWAKMGTEDYFEAFSHHPKIGVQGAKDKWASGEQKGVAGASEETLRSLVESNEEYARKFGYIFLICATGKSADEMLAELRKRMNNEAENELRVAAAEQGKITRLRLEKLLLSEAGSK